MCVWAFWTPLTHTHTQTDRHTDTHPHTHTHSHTLLSGTPRPSSMQMLIRNWCIAGGFKVMASRGGTFPIKYANPHWLCSFCSTMCLELLLEAKTVCRKHTSTTEINRRGWEQFRVNEIWSHLETAADPGSNWILTCEVKHKWDERYKKLWGNFSHFCFAARTSTALVICVATFLTSLDQFDKTTQQNLSLEALSPGNLAAFQLRERSE